MYFHLKVSSMYSLLFSVLLLLAGGVWAGPYEDAAAAIGRGDYAAELRITRPLAAKGVAWAQSLLGESYRDGAGVPKRFSEAVDWFRLAAIQGDASAQANLGGMYDFGQGVVQDYEEAVKWYRLAAAQGNASGQFDLATMYANGQGVPQNYVRAHMWFNLAAVKGDAVAVMNRGFVAKKMTSQQIAEAQKLAHECQARNFKGCD